MEKILIVDDENDIAELISDILEDEGYLFLVQQENQEKVKKME
jgi:CheY-like chemotaxis protein